MHKLVLCFILSLFFLSLNAFADEHGEKIKKAHALEETTLTLYSKPNKESDVIAKLSEASRLVRIIREKDWVKVGDRDNGQVGWINQTDYNDALKAWYQPHMQTVYIHLDQHDDDGKTKTQFTAYKNGKKLDETQAKKLYEQLKKQQAIEARSMRHFIKSMNHFFNDDEDELFFQTPLMRNFPVMQPVIVLEKEVSKESKTKEKAD